MSAAQAVAFARTLVARSLARPPETIWRHQGRTPWAVDCVGFVQLSLEAGGYTFRTNTKPIYGREAWDDQLRKALQAEFGDPVSDPRPGDVGLIRWGNGEPSHVGLLADYLYGGLSIIHAMRMHGVAESNLQRSRAGAGLLAVYRPQWGDA